MQEQQAWLTTKGILQERYKDAGNAKGNTGNANNATPLPSQAGNTAQPIMPETLN